ncbi:hypothetical protein FDH29_gp17 [Aquamicrobium phage P14]|uniref:Uncharacterized protein n=1 Tax=Aquamicrobium phage P14 TaxID=1927013 RepID=A0A1L5C053_9CAUD|nr:hypothetical protein FDH29_gp17 [Aquamicrobium phage P14]APL99475.1 hypothetical protein BB738_0170 [Aquamicrobium phage P14]
MTTVTINPTIAAVILSGNKPDLEELLSDLKNGVKAVEKTLAKLQVHVKVGDKVSGEFGRGDKKRPFIGEVIAVQGNQALVLSGFDTFKVFTKNLSHIVNPDDAPATEESQSTDLGQAATPEQEAQIADPVQTVTPEEQAVATQPAEKSGDPINNLTPEQLADLVGAQA